MAVDFTIKQHDQLPELIVTLADALSNTVPLTGILGVRFIMTSKTTGVKVIDKAATVIDASNGIIKYSWAGTGNAVTGGGDTDLADSYNAEFEVEFGDGRFETFPNSKNLQVKIFADLGGVGT